MPTTSSSPDADLLSIVTGAPTPLHDSKSFDLVKDHSKPTENGANEHRSQTLLSLFSKRGVRIAAISAEEKQRQVMACELNDGLYLSAENGGAELEVLLSRPAPVHGQLDLSASALDAGVELLKQDRADLLFLSLSEEPQSGHSTKNAVSSGFMSALDRRAGRFVDLGSIVAITGHHSRHQAMSQQEVPLVLSRPTRATTSATTRTWHNYDVFYLTLNWETLP